MPGFLKGVKNGLRNMWNTVSFKPYRDIMNGRMVESLRAAATPQEAAKILRSGEKLSRAYNLFTDNGLTAGLGEMVRNPGAKRVPINHMLDRGLLGSLARSGAFSTALDNSKMSPKAFATLKDELLNGKRSMLSLVRELSGARVKSVSDTTHKFIGEARKNYHNWALQQPIDTLINPTAKELRWIEKNYGPALFNKVHGGYRPPDMTNGRRVLNNPDGYNDVHSRLKKMTTPSFLDYNHMNLFKLGEKNAVIGYDNAGKAILAKGPVFASGQVLDKGVVRLEDIITLSGYSGAENAKNALAINGKSAVSAAFDRLGQSKTAYGCVMEASIAEGLALKNPHLHVVAEGSGRWGSFSGGQVSTGKVLLVNDAGMNHIDKFLDANMAMFKSRLNPVRDRTGRAAVSEDMKQAFRTNKRRGLAQRELAQSVLPEPVHASNLNESNLGTVDVVDMPDGGTRITNKYHSAINDKINDWRTRFLSTPGKVRNEIHSSLIGQELDKRIGKDAASALRTSIETAAMDMYRKPFDRLSPKAKLEVIRKALPADIANDLTNTVAGNLEKYVDAVNPKHDVFPDLELFPSAEYKPGGYSSEKASKDWMRDVKEWLHGNYGKNKRGLRKNSAFHPIKRIRAWWPKSRIYRTTYEPMSRRIAEDGFWSTAGTGFTSGISDLFTHPKATFSTKELAKSLMAKNPSWSAKFSMDQALRHQAAQKLALGITGTALAGTGALMAGLSGDSGPAPSGKMVAGAQSQPGQAPQSGNSWYANALERMKNMSAEDWLGYGGSAVGGGLLGYILGNALSPDNRGVSTLLGLLGAAGGAYAYHKYKTGAPASPAPKPTATA